MKKLFLYFFLLPALAFGQISKKQMFFTLASGGASVNTSIPDVDFTFKHIQRTNAAITLTANIAGAPTLTSVVWQVRDKTGLLVGMGTSGLSESIPAITTRGFYDVSCWIKTATDQYPVTWEDAFFVNTPKYTEAEADDVIDLAAGNHFVDYGSADNSGRKFYVKGSGTMGFWPSNLHGTANDPVIIQKEIGNTQIVQTCPSAVDAFTIQNNRHVIYDGYNDDGTRGWKIVTPTAGLFTIRSSGSQWTDIKILGFDLDRTGTSNDRAQVSLVPVVSAGVNATNWLDENSAIYDCRVNGSGAEGIYYNYTNDTPQSGNIPAKSRWLVIAWNDITNTGNDAIQIASTIDARVHHNFIDTWGMQTSASHENAFSINEGNTRLRVFSNFAINGDMALNMKSGLTPWNIFNSETAPSRNAIYGNIFVQGTPPSGGTPETVFNYFQTNGSSTVAWPLEVFNNTFICNKVAAAIAFNTGAFTIPNLVWANNISVKTGNAGDYAELDYTGGGTFPTNDEVNNLVYEFSNYSAIGFVDGAGTEAADFEISSLSSPVYTGASNISSFVSGVSLLDFKGLPLNASGYAYGAYSGYDAKTIAPTFDDAAAATFSSALAVTSLTEQGGTITFNANKEGLLYWAVVANNATAPTEAQLRAGGHGLASGEILDPGTALTGAITGLPSPSTDYDLYGIFVTKEDVPQASATKVDFTTTADVVAPTLSAWSIENANPNRLYFNSSEVITATTFGGFTIDQIVGTAVTVTGVTINTGSTTGHYFTLSENIEAIDYLARIAYSGSGSNLADGSSNSLASFAATLIDNNITYSKKININITNFAASTGLSSWNDVDLAGNVSVRTLVANLDDENNTSTGYAFEIANAFHGGNNGVNATAGTYINNANALLRGIEVYHTPDNSGTFRFSGLTSGKAFDLIYLMKNTFGTGAGNVNVNGAGAVGYTTGTVERKVSGTVNGSGYIDFVITQTASNTSQCVVAMILIIYP